MPSRLEAMTPLRALQTLARRALQRSGDDSLMEVAVQEIAEGLGVAGGMVLEAVGGGSAPRRLRLAAGSVDREDTSRMDDATLFATVLDAQEPVVIDDVAQSDFSTERLPADAVSIACVSIPGEDVPRGVVLAWSAQPGAFDDASVLFLQAVAGILSGVFMRRAAEEALQESEARAEAVLKTTVDAIITIDAAGFIESFNQAAERIFGYGSDEVVGKNIGVLMPEPYRSEHDGYLEAYHTTGRRKIIGIGREVTGQRKDGTVFPMYLAVSEVTMPDRQLFTGIVRNITERRRLEQEVLRVSEEERRRIGQDLHDGLGQMLTGIGLIASNLARRLRRDEASGATDIAEVAEMVKEADQYARGLARGLVPVELEQGGLRGALERLALNAERLFGIRCTFTQRGEVTGVDTTTAMHLYRIAQEAVSNAVRHGKASDVQLLLNAGQKYLRLRIRDDGIGFTNPRFDAPPETSEELRGMGVRIMHYRARIIGAALEIHGVESEGTVVTCMLRRGGETPARAIQPQLEDGPSSPAA